MQNYGIKKALIILNPNAGRGALLKLEKALDRYSDDFDYVSVEEIDDFKSYIYARLERYDVFVAAGGDGTVNSLANLLVNSEKILAVLPYGSGNGFAREMGFSKNLDSLKEDIRRKQFIETDILKVNNLCCVNISGTGIDSLVAHSFHRLNRRGFKSYINSTLRVVRDIKPLPVKISGEGIGIEGLFFLASVANIRQFGNNAIVCPMARPDDGFYNIVLLKPFPRIMMPLFAIRLMTGMMRESKFIHYVKTDKPVKIESAETRFHIDGEPLIFNDGAKVEISKKSLRVLRTSLYSSLDNNKYN
jgi:YegS/Rv2252/BmrU family lipid kinase